MPVSLDYDDYDLGGMTWEDAERALPEADFAVLPCGSVEQHSTHLPMTVDTLRAEVLTRKLAERAPEHGLELVRLPTLPYGYSEHHMNYPGTITLQPDTYREVIVDIGASLAAHDTARLLLVNFHGGNREPLHIAADRIQRDYDLRTYFVNWTDYGREQLQAEFGEDWGHAGDHETSVIELFYPNLVRTEKKEPQTRRAEFEAREYTYFDDVTEQGGLGDPTNSDPEFVEDVIADTNDRILEALRSDMEEAGGYGV